MELHDLARHDLVSYADAVSLGLGSTDLRRMAKAGSVRRIIRGWYAVTAPDRPPPWLGVDRFAAALAQHRLLAAALLRHYGGRVMASHGSCLVLHGVPLWGTDLSTGQMMRVADHHSRRRRLASVHPAGPWSPIRTPDGLSTVPVAVAVVQAGLVDVPGAPRAVESLVAADGALHRGLVTRAELAEAVAQHEGIPGIRAVRTMLAHADGRHETVAETRTALVLRALGYAFTPQRSVRDGRERTDFELDGLDVVVEFDGLTKYGLTPAGATPAGVRSALRHEKQRQSRIEDQGKEFVRLIWEDLTDVRAIDARIRRAVERVHARRRPRD